MKLLVSYILIAGQAFASSLSSDSAARGIEAVELQWNGAIDTNGTTVTLTGTAESIFKQIIALNPNYEQERGIVRSRVVRSEGLTKRDAINSGSILCNVFDEADRDAITDGIQYLYGIGDGTCAAPPGHPGNPGCSRVSCSYNSGIFLCNDQDFVAQIPCRIVADNAAGIRNSCDYSKPSGRFCHGQIWSFNRAWNVVINKDQC